MKFLIVQFQGLFNNMGNLSAPVSRRFSIPVYFLRRSSRSLGISQFILQTFGLLQSVKSVGLLEGMDDYERRKLGVFNLLNFLQFATGLIAPIIGLANQAKLSDTAWFVAILPAFISMFVLWLNSAGKYELSIMVYFILYPVFTSIVYLNGMNLGTELFFILYGILAVFFIHDLWNMLFAITLSMMSYFILTVVWRNFQFQLEVSGFLFFFNHLLAMGFIFYALFLIKRENAGYQQSIIYKNQALYQNNIEIEHHRLEIAAQATLLRKQAAELEELNALKNKLFSVVAHDLKTPMYGLRNLFNNIEEYNIPAEEVKTLIPDVISDLNYTTSLMENLLQWAKSQMNSYSVEFTRIDVSAIAAEICQLMRLQSETKQIKLRNNIRGSVHAIGDINTVRLVLRNLMSNAIKFTPAKGTVSINMERMEGCIIVSVVDTGVGISDDTLQKINSQEYYSTKGTASEAGTGLGLVLVREFLLRSGSELIIETTPGKGSSFSFVLSE